MPPCAKFSTELLSVTLISNTASLPKLATNKVPFGPNIRSVGREIAASEMLSINSNVVALNTLISSLLNSDTYNFLLSGLYVIPLGSPMPSIVTFTSVETIGIVVIPDGFIPKLVRSIKLVVLSVVLLYAINSLTVSVVV